MVPVASMVNRPAPVPPVMDQVRPLVSPDTCMLPTTVPAGEFSSTVRLAGPSMAGATSVSSSAMLL